jgi:hypothetical protein
MRDHKLANEYEWSIARFALRTPKKEQSNRKESGSLMAVREKIWDPFQKTQIKCMRLPVPYKNMRK